MNTLLSSPTADARKAFPTVEQPASAIGGSENDATGAGKSQPLSNPALGLLDWNHLRPDGQNSTLDHLLERLSVVFAGECSISFLSGRNYEYFVGGNQTLSNELKAALTEATVAAKCLFATQANQTSLVLEQLRQSEDSHIALGFGCSSKGSMTFDSASLRIGVVVTIRSAEAKLESAKFSALLKSLSAELPQWIEQWHLCRAGMQARKIRQLSNFWRSPKSRVVATLLTVLLLALFIPVPYRPQRECVAEPAVRSFVSSPIAGQLAKSLVRPGDLVSEGDVLARIDDEQLLLELSAARAEMAAAEKQRSSALATRAGGDLRLAQLEQQRIGIQIESLEKQLKELEIVSPRTGIVVQGDWFRKEGAPIDRGQTLFEVGPLDRMLIEIQLTSEDLATVKAGDFATVVVDSSNSHWQGQIIRIDPRGQLIDDQVVFLAELEVKNLDGSLRPGIQGNATIKAGAKSLGWLIFHQPANWLKKKMVW